jgi:protein-S-isoprenylcysteine O-methyltransferase Ste14
MMNLDRWKKITGVGPCGAAISLVVVLICWMVSKAFGHPEIIENPLPLRVIGIVLILSGLGLHVWSVQTLRGWWDHDRLCTGGPFKFFRHPLYAAWITFMVPGAVLCFNSLVFLFGIVAVHPIWHLLVRKEEQLMTGLFGEEYRLYADRTGRFIPRLFSLQA